MLTSSPLTAEELENEFRPYDCQRGPRCTVGLTLDRLPDEDQAKLTAALDSPHIQGANIFRWLKARGIHIEQKTIQRHRRKECRCV